MSRSALIGSLVANTSSICRPKPESPPRNVDVGPADSRPINWVNGPVAFCNEPC